MGKLTAEQVALRNSANTIKTLFISDLLRGCHTSFKLAYLCSGEMTNPEIKEEEVNGRVWSMALGGCIRLPQRWR